MGSGICAEVDGQGVRDETCVLVQSLVPGCGGAWVCWDRSRPDVPGPPRVGSPPRLCLAPACQGSTGADGCACGRWAPPACPVLAENKVGGPVPPRPGGETGSGQEVGEGPPAPGRAATGGVGRRPVFPLSLRGPDAGGAAGARRVDFAPLRNCVRSLRCQYRRRRRRE